MSDLRFKIRASQASKIVTLPKTKKARESGDLSGSHKNYIKEWLIEKKYRRTKDISSKFLDKGNMVEEASLTRVSLATGKFLTKDTENLENEFATGHLDSRSNGVVYEIKSSWDIFTFPMFEQTLPNKDYYWQVQTYLWLTGYEVGYVCYCLENLPEPLIYDECKKLSWSRGMNGEIDEIIESEVRHKYTYDDIPNEDRIRMYRVDKNLEDQELIKEQVKKSNVFIKEKIK